MSIAYVSNGSAATGSSSLSIPYPAIVAAGNLFIMSIVNKYPTNAPSAPTGWTVLANNQVSGGAGANGVGSGNVYVTVYFKVSDGTETGNVSITLTGANSACGIITKFSKSSTKNWGIRLSSGADNTSHTTFSATATTTIAVGPNDYVLAVNGINSNQNIASTGVLTATGLSGGTTSDTFGATTNVGDDCTLHMTRWSNFTGNATGALALSQGWTSATAGAVVFVVMYEAPQVIVQSDSSLVVNATQVPSVVLSSASSVVNNPIEVPSVVSTSTSTVVANGVEVPSVAAISTSAVANTPIEVPTVGVTSTSAITVNGTEIPSVSVISTSAIIINGEEVPSVAVQSLSEVAASPNEIVSIQTISDTSVVASPIESAFLAIISDSLVSSEPIGSLLLEILSESSVDANPLTNLLIAIITNTDVGTLLESNPYLMILTNTSVDGLPYLSVFVPTRPIILLLENESARLKLELIEASLTLEVISNHLELKRIENSLELEAEASEEILILQ